MRHCWKCTALEYVFEPNPQTILNELLPFYIEKYDIYISRSEPVSIPPDGDDENASENATELVDDLRLIYNKEHNSNYPSNY